MKLVGTNYDNIVCEISGLLDNEFYYNKMSRAINPYGDGKACGRILDVIEDNFRFERGER